MVSEEEFFLVFPHYTSMKANDPQDVTSWPPGAWVAGFTQETTKHCYILNMLALSLMASKEKSFEGSLAI